MRRTFTQLHWHFLFAFLTLIGSAKSHAALETRVLNIETKAGREKIHVEISRGQNARPIFVFLNGLVYDLHRWDAVTDELIRQGATVVRYAFSGQPENLRLLGKGEDPAFFTHGLELADLTEELNQVISQIGLTGRVNIVGLSYGASVAADFATRHPERVDSLILLAPLVIPLESYDTNGRWLKAWLNSVRFWENAPCDFYGAINPFFCQARDYWYDSFYDSFYRRYLDDRIQRIPSDLDPTLYKKSIFHLVRAVRDFDLRSYANLLHDTHLVIAGADSADLRHDQERVWSDVRSEQRRSLTIIRDVEHALPDTAPKRTAEILRAIGEKRPELQNGKRFEVSGDQ